MANFYKIVRTKTNLLMNKNEKPKGDKWSFDEDNRKKLPKDIKIPDISKLKETKNTSVLKKFIETNFKDHPGDTKNFWFPTTRKDANKWLDEFLKERIKLFGDYEDAVTDKSNTVFHSALSPLINLGLITPEEIIEKIKKTRKKIKIQHHRKFWDERWVFSKKYQDQNDRNGKIYRFKRSLDLFSFKNQVQIEGLGKTSVFITQY